MIADGLTKALPRQKFENFVKIIGLVDIEERVIAEKLMADLKDKLIARRKDQDTEIVVQLKSQRARDREPEPESQR